MLKNLFIILALFVLQPTVCRALPACHAVIKTELSILVPDGEKILQITKSPNNKALVLITDKAQRVYREIGNRFEFIYDFANGSPEPIHEDFTNYVSWSPDNKKVIVTHYDGGSHYFDLFDLSNPVRGDSNIFRDIEIFGTALNERPTRVIWSQDSREVAVVNGRRLSGKKYRARFVDLFGRQTGPSLVGTDSEISQQLDGRNIQTKNSSLQNEEIQFEEQESFGNIKIPYGEKLLISSPNLQNTHVLLVTTKAQRVYRISDGEFIFDFENRTSVHHLDYAAFSSWSPDGRKVIATYFYGGSRNFGFFDLDEPYKGAKSLLMDNETVPSNEISPHEVIWNSSNTLVAILNSRRFNYKSPRLRAKFMRLDGRQIGTAVGTESEIKEKLEKIVVK